MLSNLRSLGLNGTDVDFFRAGDLVIVKHIVLEGGTQHPYRTLALYQDPTSDPQIDLFMIFLQKSQHGLAIYVTERKALPSPFHDH